MPLRPPRRLPKSFNRPVSASTRALASKFSRSQRVRRSSTRRDVRRAFKSTQQSFLSFGKAAKPWIIAILLTMVGGLLAVVLFSPYFNVRQIQVRRQDPRADIEDIQRTLSPLFQERLPLVTRNEVMALLKEKYPDISDIGMGKNYPSTLTITIYFEPVIAQLIIDEPQEQPTGSGAVATNSGSYAYLTEQGTTVMSPVKIDKPLQVVHVTDWDIRPVGGEQVVTKDLLKTALRTADILREEFGLTVGSVTLYARAQEYHIKTNPLMLWFDLASSQSEQIERFRTYLKTLPGQAKQYVDLRIEGRVIYK